jgi:hypothetical protein
MFNRRQYINAPLRKLPDNLAAGYFSNRAVRRPARTPAPAHPNLPALPPQPLTCHPERKSRDLVFDVEQASRFVRPLRTACSALQRAQPHASAWGYYESTTSATLTHPVERAVTQLRNAASSHVSTHSPMMRLMWEGSHPPAPCGSLGLFQIGKRLTSGFGRSRK